MLSLNPIKVERVYNNQYLTIESKLLIEKKPNVLDIEESVFYTECLVNEFQTKIKSKPFCKKLDSLSFLTENVWIIY